MRAERPLPHSLERELLKLVLAIRLTKKARPVGFDVLRDRERRHA